MADQTREPQSKFFDLSAEIFEQVISYLDDLNSFRLCMLSHQVHRYLLPGYLRKCGIMHSDDLTTLDTLALNADQATESAFRVARTSPLITNVRHLHCKFHYPEYQLLWEFRSVYGLLCKLTSVETVVLDFSLLHGRVGLHTPPYIKPLKEWQAAFATIMRTLISKAPHDLTLVGRDHFLWFIPFDYVDVNTLPYGLFRSLLTWPSKRSERRKGPIASLQLFLSSVSGAEPPPTPLEMVIGRINLSSIISLNLDSCVVSNSEWELIGPYLTFSSLSTLSLSIDSSWAFDSLVKFLARHPTLTSLQLRDSEAAISPTQVPKTPLRPFLPNLKCLRAPIAVFPLIDASAPLVHMEIMARLCVDSDWEDILTGLKYMPSQFLEVPALLHLRVRTDTWMVEPPYVPLSSPLITSLTLELYGEGVRPDRYQTLPDWLTQFPALQQIRILHTKWKWRSWTVGEETFCRTVLAPGQSSPLRNVIIDDRIYTLPQPNVQKELPRLCTCDEWQ